MRIEKITPFLVDSCLLVRVYTDAGIVGTGEAGLWSHHGLVYEAINQLSDYYVGKDARQIEHHFQVLSRDTHFHGAVLSAAMSAVDIALWDILGKSLGQPVHQLLGGKVRDKVKTFANVVGSTLDEMAASARKSVDEGYTSLRVIPFFRGFELLPST
jgi:galactonate dehydratase